MKPSTCESSHIPLKMNRKYVQKNYRRMKNFTCLMLVSLMMIPQINSLMAQNETIKTIHNRKSVRNYTDQPVKTEDLVTLVKAGMAAPSGMDRRPWEFYILQDRGQMEALAQQLPYAKMVANAQAAIIVLGNPDVSSYWYLDCSAATQNILLAAESMGLGAVWTAAYPYEDRMSAIIKTLNIPEPYKPLVLIPIGYPTGSDKPKDKWNEAKVHINGW